MSLGRQEVTHSCLGLGRKGGDRCWWIKLEKVHGRLWLIRQRMMVLFCDQTEVDGWYWNKRETPCRRPRSQQFFLQQRIPRGDSSSFCFFTVEYPSSMKEWKIHTHTHTHCPQSTKHLLDNYCMASAWPHQALWKEVYDSETTGLSCKFWHFYIHSIASSSPLGLFIAPRSFARTMKKQKDRTLKDELSRWVGAQYTNTRLRI